jgi:hypothetical protein
MKVGKKGKTDAGYAFAPYIKMSELILPVKLIGYDKNNQPIFVKNE